mmetsp:Transcript_3715/g.9272  ORF Transcript_3715/g.9272 Transcript_3715/m.9272 type:complete len:417 (-) Transcript_3715:124-1374(-)
MVDGAHVHQAASLLDLGDDLLVRVLHVLAQEVGHWRSELALQVHGAGQRARLGDDAVRGAHAPIVLTVARCLVHHARAAVVRHVLVRHHAECARVVLEVGEQGVVGEPHKLRAREGGQHLPPARRGLGGLLLGITLLGVLLLGFLGHGARDGGQARLRHDVRLAALGVLGLDVRELSVHAQAQVGGQGPGRGGPGNEVAAFVRVAGRVDGEGHHDGGVVDVLVVLPCLKVGQRGGAAGGHRHHLQPLVHQPLGVQLAEHPPHGLHEGGVQRLVVVPEVDPAPQTRHRLLPLGRKPHDDGAALLVELVDAQCQDVGAPLELQHLLRLLLHGQAVAVPAEAARHVVARLAGVARHNVLDGASQDVAIVRQASGEGRAIVEDVLRLALRPAQLLLESIELSPQLKDLFLLLREAEVLSF